MGNTEGLIHRTPNFGNETVITVLNQNTNIEGVVSAIIYFVIFYFFIFFAFKGGIYKYYKYYVLGLLYLGTLFIYSGNITNAIFSAIAILGISFYSQKDSLMDVFESVKLQKTESDRFAMVLLFSDSDKIDLENKISNLSVIDLAKEDYKLAIEKIRRNIDKFINENYYPIILLLWINLFNMIIYISVSYYYVYMSEYFTS